jgi:hypothetical protein
MMRFVLACLTVFGLALSSSAVGNGVFAAPEYTMAAQEQQPPQQQSPQQQPPRGEIDVDITTTTGADWWANPVWIGIGAVALLLIVVLIVMAARGGGTTVIKE